MADEPLDVALLVPAWSDETDWTERTHLYVPQRPAATGPGARVWLCHGRRLFHSYRIEGFVELRDVDEKGWALVVGDGRPADRPLDDVPDESGVAQRWIQGFRYLTPGAGAFVRAPRRRTAAVPAGAEVEAATGEGPARHSSRRWARRVAGALRQRAR